MKTIYSLMLLLLSHLNFAQPFTEVDLYTNTLESISENGYYYKDINGYFNQYMGAGTWQFTVNNLTLQLRFVKKTFIGNLEGTTYKYDALIGGLRVVKNGVEVLNTFDELTAKKSSKSQYLICSGGVIKNTWDCIGCNQPDQRLYVFYREPNNDNDHFSSLFFIMHVYKNGDIPTLRIVFSPRSVIGDPTWYDPEVEDPPTKTEVILPFGTFDFVKVNP